MSEYTGEERRNGSCDGDSCVNFIKQEERLRSIGRLLKWLLVFYISNFVFQGYTFAKLTSYKEDHALTHTEHLAVHNANDRRIDRIDRAARAGEDGIIRHIAERLPEKGQVIHKALEKRIDYIEYKIGVN